MGNEQLGWLWFAQAAAGQCSLFMLAQSINSQFVGTIWPHKPNLYYLVHHLERVMVRRWEMNYFIILLVSFDPLFFVVVQKAFSSFRSIEWEIEFKKKIQKNK